MAKLNVKDLAGKDIGEIEVSDAVFAADVKEHLLWEVVRYQRAAKRGGNAKTKERSEVHGTHAKMYRQKGTGNARHGARLVNVFRGGGQVHGPRPRSYAFHVNKKVMAGALRSALSLRAGAGKIVVIRDFSVEDGKTKNLSSALAKLDTPKALLVDGGSNDSLKRSSRNLKDANFLDVHGLNVYDILRYPCLLISESSLREVEARLSKNSSATQTQGAA